MRDSYERLFSQGVISKSSLFEFGLSETIFVAPEIAKQEWAMLKNRIFTGEEVFMRGFGRNAARTSLFQRFYSIFLEHQSVYKDPTNNAIPTKLLRNWTGYSKSGGKDYSPIRNYQVSHVFGKTKNIFCFTAPWNIAYVPKIVDPFTGHEASGEYVDEYKMLFRQAAFERFGELINDFNSIVSGERFISKLGAACRQLLSDEGLNDGSGEKLVEAIQLEFSPVLI